MFNGSDNFLRVNPFLVRSISRGRIELLKSIIIIEELFGLIAAEVGKC